MNWVKVAIGLYDIVNFVKKNCLPLFVLQLSIWAYTWIYQGGTWKLLKCPKEGWGKFGELQNSFQKFMNC